MCKSILKIVRLGLIVCSLSFFSGCTGKKPIHNAAFKGDIKKVKKIIEEYPNQINVKDAQDFTPLHLAAGKGHTEIVEFLLNNGADTELVTCTGHTPLMLAAWYAGDGKYETIKTLLEHGAKVDHKTDRNQTALYYAAMRSGKEVIDLLISYGADVNTRDKSQVTPLIRAAQLNNIEGAKALIEHGADIFVKNYYGSRRQTSKGSYVYEKVDETAKDIAINKGYTELAQYLQTIEDEKEREKDNK